MPSNFFSLKISIMSFSLSIFAMNKSSENVIDLQPYVLWICSISFATYSAEWNRVVFQKRVEAQKQQLNGQPLDENILVSYESMSIYVIAENFP